MSEDQKTALELEREKREAAAVETNKSRTGVGTRVMVGATRGKNTSVIDYEAFDESQPDTLPKTLKEFQEATKELNGGKEYGNPELMDFIITGFNDAQYRLASDEIGEFVSKAWPKDVQAQFRLTVRNYSKALAVSIEDAVNTIRPAFAAKFGG